MKFFEERENKAKFTFFLNSENVNCLTVVEGEGIFD